MHVCVSRAQDIRYLTPLMKQVQKEFDEKKKYADLE
jgi:hypothetical protein